MVIAADGGAELGVHVDLAVGDDSISAHTLEAIDNVEPYPPEKDATDLELALDAALRESPTHILVVGSAGGRLDHLVSSLLLFAAEKYAAVVLDALLGDAHVHVLRGTRELDGEVGKLISLFALQARAEDVTTSELISPLHAATLEPPGPAAASNAFHEPHVRITVERGACAVVRASEPAQSRLRRCSDAMSRETRRNALHNGALPAVAPRHDAGRRGRPSEPLRVHPRAGAATAQRRRTSTWASASPASPQRGTSQAMPSPS